MSGTTLDVTLSSAEQTELEQAGVYAYAVYFDKADGNAAVTAPITLVDNGVVANDGTFAIPLTDMANPDLVGGKVYFVVQSLPVGETSTLADTIADQSNINPGTASANDFGYDSFEVTLSSGPNDAGNLTSVNGFGLPMDVSVDYDNGTSASVGYAVSGGTIAGDVSTITNGQGTYSFSEGPLAGSFRMSTSPSEANAANTGTVSSTGAFPETAWLPYIQALESAASTSDILITGLFNGAADAAQQWHNGGYYAYQLQWDAASQTFWLVPTVNSQIQGAIALTPDDIASNIYSQTGTVGIYSSTSDPTPFTTMVFGANNQWGAVLAQFLTGFTGGYYGEVGTPLNTQLTGAPIDLDQNFNWDPDYAFGNNGTMSLDLAPGSQTSDPYSKIFFYNSNSYGSPYSDALMSQYATGGPLISVSQPDDPGGADVSAIDLTIYADNETPQGYTPPVIHNYIAPEAGAYAPPSTMSAGDNITLSFNAAVLDSAGIDFAPTGTIAIGIMTGDAGGVPSWDTVVIDAAEASNGLGLWQQWSIAGSAAAGYSVAPVSPAVTLPSGNLQILNLPSATSGVSWYQITLGYGSSEAKTYNLYTTNNADGTFENPNYAGPGGSTPQAGALAVDGLATLSLPAVTTQSINTFTVNFTTGSTVTYNPALVVENSGSAYFPATAPTAPVVGTIASGGTFSALAGQTSPTSNAVTTTVSDGLEFGWTGTNPNAYVVTNGTVTQSWVNVYTNKVNPDDFAVVTIENAIGQSGTISTQADIDGAWQTPPEQVNLGNGTYTITMQDALAVSGGGGTVPGAPVTQESTPLVLTVDNPGNALADNDIVVSTVPCFAGGTRIATPDGPVAVEDLRIGDRVVTIDGQAEPVVWIGQRQVNCARHPEPERVWPVRIAAGAFAAQAPLRDLFLSPDHAVYTLGVLIPVKHLVNGATVAQLPVDRMTYFHIELACHQVILAEGLPAETYLDTGDRGAFGHGGEAAMLHPVWGGDSRDVSLMTEALGYAPLRVAGPAVEQLRAQLAERAGDRIAAA
jgi:hypothetical protein